MPEECEDKFPRCVPNCVYVERNADISQENQQIKYEISKLKEEIIMLNSAKKDLTDLVVKLNMHMHMGY